MKNGNATDRAYLQALRDEAQRIEEDAIHSAKRHFNTSSGWGIVHYLLGVPATILAGSTAAAAIKAAPNVAAVVGVLAAFFSALMTFLKPNDKSAQHREVGNQYLALRNDSRIFREIDLIEAVDDLKKGEKLRRLAQRRSDINRSALPTPRWAFDSARKGIAEGEAAYRVDVRSVHD